MAVAAAAVLPAALVHAALLLPNAPPLGMRTLHTRAPPTPLGTIRHATDMNGVHSRAPLTPLGRIGHAPGMRSVRSRAPVMQLGNIGKGVGDFMKQFGGGDDSGLSEEEKSAMEDRFKSGSMSFNDFLTQVNIMQKAGSMQQLMSRTPFGGGGSGPSAEQLAEGERKLKRYRKYVEAMKEEERSDPPSLIAEAKAMRAGGSGERVQRIAAATDSEVEDVGRFLFEFDTLRSAAVKFARGDSPEKIREEMMAENRENIPKNRAQRRAAKRGKPGAVRARPGGGGFGR